MVLTGVASLAVGGVVSRSSDRPVARAPCASLLIVAVASAVTWGVGTLFATTIG